MKRAREGVGEGEVRRGEGEGAVGERVDKLSSSGARRRESRGAMREARGKRHGEGRV